MRELRMASVRRKRLIKRYACKTKDLIFNTTHSSHACCHGRYFRFFASGGGRVVGAEQCGRQVGARHPRDRDPSRADSVRCPYSLGTHHPQICAYIFVFLPWRERVFVRVMPAASCRTAVAARCLRGRRGGNILSLCLSGRAASGVCGGARE